MLLNIKIYIFKLLFYVYKNIQKILNFSFYIFIYIANNYYIIKLIHLLIRGSSLVDPVTQQSGKSSGSVSGSGLKTLIWFERRLRIRWELKSEGNVSGCFTEQRLLLALCSERIRLGATQTRQYGLLVRFQLNHHFNKIKYDSMGPFPLTSFPVMIKTFICHVSITIHVNSC